MAKKAGLGLQVDRFGCQVNGPRRDSAVCASSNESLRVCKHGARELSLMNVFKETNKLYLLAYALKGVWDNLLFSCQLRKT